MDKKNILSVKNLKKIYSSKQNGETHALNDLNLDVKEGEIFGLLGPNGAGKNNFYKYFSWNGDKNSRTSKCMGF